MVGRDEWDRLSGGEPSRHLRNGRPAATSPNGPGHILARAAQHVLWNASPLPDQGELVDDLTCLGVADTEPWGPALQNLPRHITGGDPVSRSQLGALREDVHKCCMCVHEGVGRPLVGLVRIPVLLKRLFVRHIIVIQRVGLAHLPHHNLFALGKFGPHLVEGRCRA